MRKVVVWILILVVTHIAVFFGGSIVGGRMSREYLSVEFEKANASIMLSHYVIFRDIAKNIKVGNDELARCSAELGASSNFDDVKVCLANDQCKASIEKDVYQLAPEMVSGQALGFDYKKRNGMERRCEGK